MIDYSRIPAATMESLEAWVRDGRHVGHFLTKVLKNDLMGAVSRADDNNRVALFDICSWLANRAPLGCYGSPEMVAIWAQDKLTERRARLAKVPA